VKEGKKRKKSRLGQHCKALHSRYSDPTTHGDATVTQMTQGDATQNGLRLAEMPVFPGSFRCFTLFHDAMTQESLSWKSWKKR
jgi:hypothetical protein